MAPVEAVFQTRALDSAFYLTFELGSPESPTTP